MTVPELVKDTSPAVVVKRAVPETALLAWVSIIPPEAPVTAMFISLDWIAPDWLIAPAALRVRLPVVGPSEVRSILDRVTADADWT